MRINRSIAAVAAVLAVACAGACSHPDADVTQAASTSEAVKSDSSGAAASQGDSGVDRLVAYADCMREHGVDMPDPDPSGAMYYDQTVTGDPDWDAAESACSAITEGPADGAPEVESDDDYTLALVDCLRKAGHDVPDPGPGTGSFRMRADEDDPTLDADMRECERQLQKSEK